MKPKGLKWEPETTLAREQCRRLHPRIIFNDKHLSWKWEWAKEMVETARKLDFPFLAGSSLPVTWRMPAVDMPHGAEAEEVLGVAVGRVDSYDFHALEMSQCMAERRTRGE